MKGDVYYFKGNYTTASELLGAQSIHTDNPKMLKEFIHKDAATRPASMIGSPADKKKLEALWEQHAALDLNAFPFAQGDFEGDGTLEEFKTCLTEDPVQSAKIAVFKCAFLSDSTDTDLQQRACSLLVLVDPDNKDRWVISVRINNTDLDPSQRESHIFLSETAKSAMLNSTFTLSDDAKIAIEKVTAHAAFHETLINLIPSALIRGIFEKIIQKDGFINLENAAIFEILSYRFLCDKEAHLSDAQLKEYERVFMQSGNFMKIAPLISDNHRNTLKGMGERDLSALKNTYIDALTPGSKLFDEIAKAGSGEVIEKLMQEHFYSVILEKEMSKMQEDSPLRKALEKTLSNLDKKRYRGDSNCLECLRCMAELTNSTDPVAPPKACLGLFQLQQVEGWGDIRDLLLVFLAGKGDAALIYHFLQVVNDLNHPKSNDLSEKALQMSFSPQDTNKRNDFKRLLDEVTALDPTQKLAIAGYALLGIVITAAAIVTTILSFGIAGGVYFSIAAAVTPVITLALMRQVGAEKRNLSTYGHKLFDATSSTSTVLRQPPSPNESRIG